MQTIFDQGNDDFVQRIQSLTPESAALWGKMNCAQMMTHCTRPIRIATGEVPSKRSLVGKIFGGLVKKMVMGPKPFKRDGPTDPQFVVRDERDFDRERAELLAGMQRLKELGAGGLTTDPHPFFGKMSPADWDTLMSKHLDHHLQQFGA